MAVKKLKRTAVVSFITDPYLAILFKRIYLKNIKDEIDELNIQINGENQEMINFLIDLWRGEAKYIITHKTEGKTIAHGEALNELYKISDGDIFITLDSDNFVYKKGVINDYCDKIEKGLFDCVVSKGPFMSFFNRKILEKVNVDFREMHKDGRFYDTMRVLMNEISESTESIYNIPVDKLPDYEHIGRMSAFGVYAEQCYLDKDKGLERNVRKLFGRANRVALIKYIYDITKKDCPPDYNESYWKTFIATIDNVGHKLNIIDDLIKTYIKPKLKDYE